MRTIPILRRVRQNLALPNPRPLFDVVLDASLEVRSAIVYATFIVALVFLPVLMMSGIQGKLFSPLAVAFKNRVAKPKQNQRNRDHLENSFGLAKIAGANRITLGGRNAAETSHRELASHD